MLNSPAAGKSNIFRQRGCSRTFPIFFFGKREFKALVEAIADGTVRMCETPFHRYSIPERAMKSTILDGPRMTVAEAAEYCSVHITTIHRWRQTGVRGQRLRCIHIGGRIEVRLDDLVAFIEEISDPPSERDVRRDCAERAKLAGDFLNFHGV